jgi:hypothetical protein
MRFYQFKVNEEILKEASPYLSGAELFKDRTPDRKQTFINQIKSSTPFKTKDGKDLIIPPTIDLKQDPPQQFDNLKTFTDWVNGGNPKAQFSLYGHEKDDKELTPVEVVTKASVSPLIKGAEYGGSKFVAGGKEAAGLKPADIGIDAGGIEYDEKSLLSAIQNNAKLQQTNVGRKVIDAANQIANGDNEFDLSELSAGEFAAFRDDAGEYLGPLMMMKGMATFVGDVEQAFFKHVGLKSFAQMKMIFPTAKNAKLADTEGVVAGFENPVSGNKIWISVKGGKSGKGAAFTIGDFAVPDDVAEKNPRASSFLKLQKDTTTKNANFVNANFFQKLGDNSFNSYMDKEMDNNEINDAINGKGLSQYLEGILDKMKVNNLAKFRDDKDDPVQAYKNLNYGLETLLAKVVNKEDALPNLAPVVRETLQQNFIKLSNKMRPQNIAEKNAMNSVVTWPNRELATGEVVLAVGSSMGDGPKSRLRMMVN